MNEVTHVQFKTGTKVSVVTDEDDTEVNENGAILIVARSKHCIRIKQE